MKKRLALFLLFAISLPAAAEIKFDISGELRTRGAYVINKDLDNSTSGKVALVDSRLRLWLTPKIRKDLKVVFGIEIGDVSWGEEVGSFSDDNNLGKSSGGAQGTDGVNIETKHIYMQYKPAGGMKLRLGLMPFAAPCKMVLDSDLAAASFSWKMGGLSFTALYARAFAGPRGIGISGDPEDSQAVKDSDSINLDDDRNSYYLGVTLKKEWLSLTGWVLYDDNGRFSEYAPTGEPLTSSKLLYAGLSLKGKSGDKFKYRADAVLNTGMIEETGAGSVNVLAWALHARAELRFSRNTAVGCNLRSVSGNSTSQTNNTDTVRQFTVLDGSDGDSGSLLSLLFGGGVYNHQSYFNHKTASARMVNITTGYFVRDDPGITSVEGYFEHNLFNRKLRIRLIGGYGFTTKAVALTGGGTGRALGFETDLALRYKANKNLAFYLTAAFLLPGEALAPTIALDNNTAYDGTRDLGEDPAFKIEAMARVRF